MKTNLHHLKALSIAVLLGATLLASCSKDPKVTPPVTSPIHPVSGTSNAYVTTLFEFNPAPGQFINTGLGDTVAAKATLKTDQGLVSLGAWGGYITVGFDHTVLDKDGQADFVVYGNAFSTFAEPGVIWVMQDTNGNGKPDDTWYEIKGSAFYDAGYTRNYSVTYTRPACDTCSVPWHDNKGKNGVVQTNIFNTQAYFPKGQTSSYTLTGSLLPSSKINMDNPDFITSGSFDYGYGDNTSGGDKIDIATAMDANGNKVNLKGVDFIKVQTGILANMGWLGEQSTEFCGAADLSLLK